MEYLWPETRISFAEKMQLQQELRWSRRHGKTQQACRLVLLSFLALFIVSLSLLVYYWKLMPGVPLWQQWQDFPGMIGDAINHMPSKNMAAVGDQYLLGVGKADITGYDNEFKNVPGVY
jgi:hypothetical protein